MIQEPPATRDDVTRTNARPPSPAEARVRVVGYGVCALFLLLGAVGAFPYPDEGLYVLGAQRAFDAGDFYGDAAFFHMPGSAVALAGLLPLVGPDLVALRLLLAVLSFAGLLLIGAVVRGEKGPRAEAVFVALAATSPFALTTLPAIASYSALAFCGLALSAGGLASRSTRGAVVAGAGIGFATSVRIAYALAAGVLLLALLRRDGSRAAAAFLAAVTCTVAALTGWWLLTDPVASWHNVITAQLERAHWTPYLWSIDVWRNKLGVAGSLLLHALAPALLLLLAWAAGRRAARAPARPPASGPLLHALLWPIVLVHFLPTPAYLVYFASAVPLLFAACALAVADRPIAHLPRWVALAALLGLAAQDNVFGRGHPYPFAWVADAPRRLGEQGWDRAVAELRARTEPGALIWSFDTSLVVQAGRAVLPGFEMSYFGFYPEATRAYAEQRRVLDLSLALEPLVDRRAAAAVASRRYTWEPLRHDPAARERLFRALCSAYAPTVRIDDARYGPIWLLLPREATRRDRCCERMFADVLPTGGSASCPEP